MLRWLTSLAVFVCLAAPAFGQSREGPPPPLIERSETPLVCPPEVGEIPTDVSVEKRLDLAHISAACLLRRAERVSWEIGSQESKRFWPIASQSYPYLKQALELTDSVACESEHGIIMAEKWASLICIKFPWAKGGNPHPYFGHPKGCFQQIGDSYRDAAAGIERDAYFIDKKCLPHVREWEERYLNGRLKISFASEPDLKIIDIDAINPEIGKALMVRCRDALEKRDVCSRDIETP